MKILKSHVEADQKRLELEILSIKYIENIINFDKSIGREKNFLEMDWKEIGSHITEFRDMGCRVFIGGGNIFILKIEHKLTGWQAIIMQMRGLAQRVIYIKENLNDNQ